MWTIAHFFFFSYQCGTNIPNRISVLINVGLTLLSGILHLLVILLIKLGFQNHKETSKLIYGLDLTVDMLADLGIYM